jgi:hypothetical protein
VNTLPPKLPEPLKAALAHLRLQSPPNLPAICKIPAYPHARMPTVHKPHARCSCPLFTGRMPAVHRPFGS